jgi:hypothetical protein
MRLSGGKRLLTLAVHCFELAQRSSMRPQSQSMRAKREQRFIAPRALPLSYR